jgi:HEAT repeat protein
MVDAHRFLYTVLLALVRHKKDNKIIISFDPGKGQLFLNGKELPLAGEGYSKAGLENRIHFLAGELGARELTVFHADVALRALLKDRGTASKNEIIEVILSSTFRKDSGGDVIKQWRQAFEMRVIKAELEHCRIEWLHEIPEEKWHDCLESGPLLEKWPHRLLEDKFWAYTDTAFPGIEPFRLDQIWTDLHLINPDEPGEFLDNVVESSFSKLLDYRYEERQWFAQPAAFVMEQLQGTTAVIGAPGSGKTTMLKWLARQLLLNPDGKFLLPLFVSLRQYALVRRSSILNNCPNIVDYALQTAGIQNKRQRELWLNFLDYLAGSQRDNILLLLDGWDEVPAEDRILLKKELEDLSHGYSYVITSRPSAYPRNLPTDRFYEIAELPWDSIYKLVIQWFEAGENPAMADCVLEYLDKYPDLKRMARNPFLLSLVCGFTFSRHHTSNISLPRSRTELYRESVRSIIEYHNRYYPEAPFHGEICRLLERLAYWLFTGAPHAPCYTFDYADVEKNGGNKEYMEKVLKPSRFITKHDYRGESFHFLHTTFQEYFAACHIGKKDKAEVEELFGKIAYDAGWQEIFLFTAGQSRESAGVERQFWKCMRKLTVSPDRFGFIYIQLARYTAEYGVIDGGRQLLGLDLREKLRQFIISEEKINHYVDAYILLDAVGYVKQVKDYLAQPHISSRLEAKLLRTLGRVKTADTSDELVRQIINGEKNAGAVAAYQLTRVLDNRGLHLLLKEARNPDRPTAVQKRIIDALGYSGRLEALDVLYGIAKESEDLTCPAITALGHIGGDSAADRLKNLFEESGISETRLTVVSALGNCISLQARNYLLYLLALPLEGHQLTGKILEELSEMPINRGFEMLIEYLDHPGSRVRGAAAAALVNAAPGRGIIADALLKAGNEDPDPAVRIQALASLRNRARPSDARALAHIVESGERSNDEKANALRALVQTASRLRHLQDGPWLHQLAFRIVAEALKQKYSNSPALEAAQVSYLLGNDIAPLLMEIVSADSHSPSVRESAVASLGKLKYKPAEALLMDLMTRFPDNEGDEDIMEEHPGKRLAQRSAEALTDINPTALLNRGGKTARNALADFARRNGCLVFNDHILDASGKRIAGTPDNQEDSKTGQVELKRKNKKQKKILFLSANQVGARHLKLDEEYREIETALRGSKKRRLFQLIPKLAVRYPDFRQALLDHEPHIVHFSGHGTEDGLMVLDEIGAFPKLMPAEAVSELFKLCSGYVRCVILSACYSESQAEAIVKYIPYVIGMKKEIKVTSATVFAAGFYDALGAGRSIEDAFLFGRQAIMQSSPEVPLHLIPVLKKREKSRI